MAKTYHAVNTIRHGVGNGEEKVFAPDEQVTGLSKDAMVILWNSGALYEKESDAVEPDEESVQSEETEAPTSEDVVVPAEGVQPEADPVEVPPAE